MMQLPQSMGGPERRLHRAAWTARALGVASLGLGGVLWHSLSNAIAVLQYGCAGATAVPGLIYLAFAWRLTLGQRWACIMFCVLAIAHAAVFVLLALLLLISCQLGGGKVETSLSVWLCIFIAMGLLCMLTAIRSVQALGATIEPPSPGHGEPWGFEPVVREEVGSGVAGTRRTKAQGARTDRSVR